MPLTSTAIDEAVKWAVPAILTAIGGWAAVKRKAIKAWRESRARQKEAQRQLPQVVAEVAASVAQLAERESTTTGQFKAINDHLEGHTTTLEAQNRLLADIAAMSHGQMELDPVPRFICDEYGRNRYVNTAYARMVGCGRDELDGFGYQRFVPHSLNPDFMAGFREASQQHRIYDAEVTFQRPDGTRFLALVKMVPHPEDLPPATHWNGMLTKLREVTP